jgi:hypothetical protein
VFPEPKDRLALKDPKALEEKRVRRATRLA